MDLTFFGLTTTNASEARLALFSQIHQIVFHGNGYDWNTVYNMPIWLRKFTFATIKEHFDKEREAANNANGQENVAIGTDGLVKDRSLFSSKNTPPVSKPGISPKRLEKK